MLTGRFLPHPIPYQGSKRALAHKILPLFPTEKVRLFEPFAGSAAVSIAAVANGKAKRVILNDANEPLMHLWEKIIKVPVVVMKRYRELWHRQLGNERSFYDQVRDEFNCSHEPELLLYLLARCVKASVRYNSKGEFNQSPDNRRKGARPNTLEKHVLGVSELLKDKAEVRCGDFRDAIDDATHQDIVYMDPPYQGVCGGRDSRYSEKLPFAEFIDVLHGMNDRRLSFILSYDGRSGNKRYGRPLPADLNLTHIEVRAGVSTQATLLGRKAETVESLYVSRALTDRTIGTGLKKRREDNAAQIALL